MVNCEGPLITTGTVTLEHPELETTTECVPAVKPETVKAPDTKLLFCDAPPSTV